MMDVFDRHIARMAELFALQCEVEGMKALNAEREDQGYAQAYDEEAFHNHAQKMRAVAERMGEYE